MSGDVIEFRFGIRADYPETSKFFFLSFSLSLCAPLSFSHSTRDATTPKKKAMGNEVNLDRYNGEQVRLMEEMCILVDRDDNNIGADSKKACK